MTTALQNFIELLTIPFQAGESKIFMVSGQYFELIDATDPVDVLLLSRHGEQRGIMRSAEASFHLKNTDFQQIQITSPTAQTIRIGYGSGEAGTRRAAGAVSIVGTVPVSGPLTDAQLRATPPLVRTDQESSGWWNSTVTIGVNGVLTVFNAAANLNGAIIHHMEAADSIAAAGVQVFLTKATTPATVVDGNVIAQSFTTSNNGTNANIAIRREQPIRIPAGVGLFFVSGLAGAAGFMRSCSYRLL